MTNIIQITGINIAGCDFIGTNSKGTTLSEQCLLSIYDAQLTIDVSIINY